MMTDYETAAGDATALADNDSDRLPWPRAMPIIAALAFGAWVAVLGCGALAPLAMELV